jgi:hypothetical protein
LDGAGTGPREAEALFVLFDLGGDGKEGEDDRRELGLGQCGVGQRVGASSLGQGRGRPREPQPQGVGQEGGGRGPLPVAVHVHRLASVCASAPGTLEVCGAHGWAWRLPRRDHQAGLIPCLHAFRLAHDPPGLGPGLGRLDACVVEAPPGRRGLAMRRRAPLVRPTTRRLEGGSGLAEPDGMPSQAKDQSEPTPRREDVAALWGSTMPSATDQQRGGRPMGAQRRPPPDHAQGMFGPRRAGCWPQGGRDQGGRGPCDPAERPLARVLIVMLREGTLLRPMGGSIGVVESEDHGWGRRGVTRAAGVHQGPRETREVWAVSRVVQAGAGGRTGSVRLSASRGDRATPSVTKGARRRLVASFPSASPDALGERRWAKRAPSGGAIEA